MAHGEPTLGRVLTRATGLQLFSPPVYTGPISDKERVKIATGVDRLRVWMPDTLVFEPGQPPFWLYCDKDGVVCQYVW